MQVNRNGIPVHTPRNKRQRKPLNINLPMRRFALIDDEAEVEVVVPHFSPILDLLTSDGWKEVVESN